jgi:hypothetical protein
VKTDLGGGIENVNNWVAKVRKSDIKPLIKKHANDALMYQCFAYLLDEYKESLKMCEHLDKNLGIKASRITVSENKIPLIIFFDLFLIIPHSHHFKACPTWCDCHG